VWYAEDLLEKQKKAQGLATEGWSGYSSSSKTWLSGVDLKSTLVHHIYVVFAS
jgi:hypothetical protein